MFQHSAGQECLRRTGKGRDCRITLPGYGRPLDYAPREKNIYGVESRSMFPCVLDDRDIAMGFADLPVLTLREIEMVKAMEDLTDIPQWWKNIHEPGVQEEWKKMALSKGKDVTPNMANWIIEELKFKSMIYEHSNAVTLYSGDISKSDSNVPDSLLQDLRCAYEILEYDDPELQFYHPRSMNKQRDLLPVGLYQLIYGKSRILPDRVIGVDEALQFAGQGEVVPVPTESGITRQDIVWRISSRADIETRPFSRHFQILPSDWEMGNDGRWHIASYINNLHPVKHKDIYKTIEDVFNCLIPQFNLSMAPLKNMLHSRARIEYHKAEYYPISKEAAAAKPQMRPGEPQSEYDERYEQWRIQNFRTVQPDAGQFTPWAVPISLMSKLPEDLPSAVRIEEPVDLSKDYKDRGLQVVTRLLGIDLTPEDPFYETEWHVEGQMNEHICAAAFVSFDSNNMLDPEVEFRNIIETGTLEEVEHEPNDFIWLGEVFGLENGEPAVQKTGSFKFPVGRTVIFTSMVQHRYRGFELSDKTKPGYFRGLVFLLVDPNIRIISTANIPPQRLDWILDVEDESAGLNATMAKLALDNKNQKGNMPMSLSEALEFRTRALEDLVEFERYQQVAFESNVLML